MKYTTAFFTVFRLAVKKPHDCAGLCHRFDGEHSRHDGSSGKMAFKERLIDRDIL